MMDAVQQVEEVLAEAERRLAELTGEALRRRDYAAVQWLSAVAARVANAAKEAVAVDGASEGMESRGMSPPEARAFSETGSDLLAARHSDAAPMSAAAPERPRTTPPAAPERAGTGTAATPAPTQFPRFYRDDGQLVKIGYSKSERRTYEHRSPRVVLDRLTSVLVAIAADKEQFTTERILPPNDQRLADVPTYQIYLCLAFLVRRGLVKRHGRAGYTIEGDHPGDLLSAVSAAWEALPRRRA